MNCVDLRILKKGDFFTLKPLTNPDLSEVWIRGDYDPVYGVSCSKLDCRIRDIFLKGTKKVYVGFTF